MAAHRTDRTESSQSEKFDLKNQAEQDIVNSNCKHDFVIKYGEYYCQECGIAHDELIKPNWKRCPKCNDIGTYGLLITGEWFCIHCNYRGAL